MDSGFLAIIRDAYRFILYNTHIIEAFPLQTYVSALIFSPSKSSIRELFTQEIRRWIITRPLVEERWSPCLQILEGHAGFRSVMFSPDGRRLASASNMVQIWDAETGALQQTLQGHTMLITSVAFSHDGRRLASASYDMTVRIWDAETGVLQRTLEGHTCGIESVTFSHDGRRLASASDDETVRIWDAETGFPQQTLDGHASAVNSVMFSPDGRRLVSASGDSTVRIWNAETGVLQMTLKGHASAVNSVTFSYDGLRLASASFDETVRIWNTETGGLQQTLKSHTGLVYSVTFSPDGRRLASASYDMTVRIWDAEMGVLQRTLEGHTDAVNSVTFSHDGRRLASASNDDTGRIWDVEMDVLQRNLEGHTSMVVSVTFSPDGHRLASASYDETVQIWNAETGALEQTLHGHTDVVCSVMFSEDGRRLVSASFSHDVCRPSSASDDMTVRIWDAETGESLTRLLFSHNDSHLVTERGSIILGPPSLHSITVPNWSAYCPRWDRSWITLNGSRILWIPPEYRHSSSMFQGNTVAIGCFSGRVLLIRFSSLDTKGISTDVSISTSCVVLENDRDDQLGLTAEHTPNSVEDEARIGKPPPLPPRQLDVLRARNEMLELENGNLKALLQEASTLLQEAMEGSISKCYRLLQGTKGMINNEN